MNNNDIILALSCFHLYPCFFLGAILSTTALWVHASGTELILGLLSFASWNCAFCTAMVVDQQILVDLKSLKVWIFIPNSRIFYILLSAVFNKMQECSAHIRGGDHSLDQPVVEVLNLHHFSQLAKCCIIFIMRFFNMSLLQPWEKDFDNVLDNIFLVSFWRCLITSSHLVEDPYFLNCSRAIILFCLHFQVREGTSIICVMELRSNFESVLNLYHLSLEHDLSDLAQKFSLFPT